MKPTKRYTENQEVLDNMLMIAAAEGLLQEVCNLVHSDANVNPTASHIFHQTPLHSAVEGGHVNVVEYLLDAGADINARRHSWEKTPLHLAVERLDESMTLWLMKQGKQLDVDATDAYGQAPLHYAAYPLDCKEPDSLQLCKCLIENGANVHVITSNASSSRNRGATPLHLAACLGKLAIVHYLVETAKADVKVKDEEGLSPLHYALTGIKPTPDDVVEYLIEQGADVYARTKNGETLVEYTNKHDRDAAGVIEYVSTSPTIAKENFLHFAMGRHKRVGAKSSVNMLPNDVMGIIHTEVMSNIRNARP